MTSSNLIDDEDLVSGCLERNIVLDVEKADAGKALGLEENHKHKDGVLGAMVVLGLMFVSGNFRFEKDKKLAYHWFDKAADLGNASGMGNVGTSIVFITFL